MWKKEDSKKVKKKVITEELDQRNVRRDMKQNNKRLLEVDKEQKVRIKGKEWQEVTRSSMQSV